MILRYNQPAPNTMDGWENYSLPLGNGHFGINAFGGVATERLQFTDKSLWIDDATKQPDAWNRRALTSFADILLTLESTPEVDDYERYLDINRAVAGVKYRVGSVTYLREMFASYPDRVFVMRLTSSEKKHISLTVKAVLPFLSEFRTGEIQVQGNRILFKGDISTFGCKYEGQCEVMATGGVLKPQQDSIKVVNADELILIISLGTNYRLTESVFLKQPYASKLKEFPSPHEMIQKTMDRASEKTWSQLLATHLEDYQKIFSRVRLQLGPAVMPSTEPTDVLLEEYRKKPGDPYLETLYFQYGRYLLIAASREGCLPANLQGTWNAHEFAPWSGGYWANINMEMNYWPSFNTNLRETFEPYMAYFRAMHEAQKQTARKQVKLYHPTALADDCGMTGGTGNSAYYSDGPNGASGFGTGPFIVQNMWEYYEFTRDREVLEQVWPFLRASSLFTTKIVKNVPGYGNLLLCDPSWSPENQPMNSEKKALNMPGSTYDQSLIYEGHLHTLEAAELLDIKDDPLLDIIRKQLPLLDPIQIGTSGQIKEFRQESEYADFGEPNHRHISQLVGLFPGAMISDLKPAWLAAARVSLQKRGDKSTGWAMAHRLNCWARLQNGERSYKLLRTLLKEGTFPNLWDKHPPFQIDGNFGGTAGIAEMLIQSHAGYIDILPACPDAWAEGEFTGLCARGGFEVSARWKNRTVNQITIRSLAGTVCRIKLPDPQNWQITNAADRKIDKAQQTIQFSTEKGKSYLLQP